MPAAASDSSAEEVRDAAAPAQDRWPNRRRILVAAGFIVVAVSTALVLVALALVQEQPGWWAVVDTTDPRTISTAEAVENGITTALTQVRGASASADDAPGRPWSVFITTDQANAWLGVRLRRWLADQSEQGAIDFRWPDDLREVQVAFTRGHIHIGARVMRPGASVAASPRPQVLAAVIRPMLDPDGALWFTAERVQIGRLPLPASWVLGRAGRGDDAAAELASRPQSRRLLAALAGQGPAVRRPTIRLADGRRVRLVAIAPTEGRLLLTCVTEQRAR